MDQKDIIQGIVTRVINGNTFEIAIAATSENNRMTYASKERVLIVDFKAPKLWQKHGFHIKRLVRKTFEGKELHIRVNRMNDDGFLETIFADLTLIIRE